jgi:hypothetical protein
MAALIDTRLYLPEDWCHDEARCKKAAIPTDELRFFSKSLLARAMLVCFRFFRLTVPNEPLSTCIAANLVSLPTFDPVMAGNRIVQGGMRGVHE